MSLLAHWTAENTTIDIVNNFDLIFAEGYGGTPISGRYVSGLTGLAFDCRSYAYTESLPDYGYPPYLYMECPELLKFAPGSSFKIKFDLRFNGDDNFKATCYGVNGWFEINAYDTNLKLTIWANVYTNLIYPNCISQTEWNQVRVEYSNGNWKVYVNDIIILCSNSGSTVTYVLLESVPAESFISVASTYSRNSNSNTILLMDELEINNDPPLSTNVVVLCCVS